MWQHSTRTEVSRHKRGRSRVGFHSGSMQNAAGKTCLGLADSALGYLFYGMAGMSLSWSHAEMDSRSVSSPSRARQLSTNRMPPGNTLQQLIGTLAVTDTGGLRGTEATVC